MFPISKFALDFLQDCSFVWFEWLSRGAYQTDVGGSLGFFWRKNLRVV